MKAGFIGMITAFIAYMIAGIFFGPTTPSFLIGGIVGFIVAFIVA